MMNKLSIITTLAIFIFSCKKEIQIDKGFYLEEIQLQLKDSISSTLYNKLDFSKMIFVSGTVQGSSLVKIPIASDGAGLDFVLLNADSKDHFSFGRIVHLRFDESIKVKSQQSDVDGAVEIFSLKEQLVMSSRIKDGYIISFQPHAVTKVAVVPMPDYKELPEVIISTTASSKESTQSYTTWIQLNSLLYNTSLSGSGGYYTSSSGSGGSGGTSSAPSTVGGIPNQIYIDFETQDNSASIDVKKYLKCFRNISDVGAKYTVTLYADIPVDAVPNIGFDWRTGSPGHTFLQLKKENGTQSVQQFMGFYPDQGWKVGLTTAPVKAKVVDNAGHEFNASYSMLVSGENFKAMLTQIEYLSNFVLYDLDEYNCTDWALDVFNYRRGSNQLVIPKLDIPGGNSVTGSSTPQGLYMKLKEMKTAGGIEAKAVTIPGAKGFAGPSHGACN